MPSTITIDIPTSSDAIVGQLLTYHEELQALALSAPHGTLLVLASVAVRSAYRAIAHGLL